MPSILGFNSGRWYEGSPLRNEWDWYIYPEGNTLHIENATEYHEGFRSALKEIASKYPIENMVLSFDGNQISVADYLENDIDWSNLTFYHGTSSNRWILIQQWGGLYPRRETGQSTAYGFDKDAPSSNEDLIYLTTQIGTARFAASDASRRDRSKPVVLKIAGLDENYMVPDEDSRRSSARESLAMMGSIGYTIPIPLSQIELFQQL